MTVFPAARWKALVREGAWVLAGQGSASIGAVVVTCMLASWMAPSEFGLFSLGITASAVGQGVIFGPWAGSALRFDALATSEGRSRGFLATVTGVQLQLSLLALAITVAVLAALWWTHHRQVLLLTSFAAISVIAAAWAFLASSLLSARRQRAVIAIHQGVTPWLRLLLVLSVMSLLGRNANATMIGWAVATVMIAISQWTYIPRRNLPADASPHTTYRTRMISYTVPFLLWGAFSCAQAAMDRWSLRSATDLATVGIYSAAFQLGYAPALLLGSFVEQMVAPVAFAGAGDARDGQRLGKALRRVRISGGLLVVAAMVGAAVIYLCVPVIHACLPVAYASVAGFMSPLFLAGGLMAAAQVLIIVPLSSFHSSRVVVPRVTISSLAVAAFFLAAYRWGLHGVVIAQVVVSIIFLTWISLITVMRPYAVKA